MVMVRVKVYIILSQGIISIWYPRVDFENLLSASVFIMCNICCIRMV